MQEFEQHWLPHISDAGLNRLVELLEKRSPLLIHGMFTRACAMGCLASHIAWHHPTTEHLYDEAGVVWLTRVAKLNPATSALILDWDRAGPHDWELHEQLLAACRAEQQTRRELSTDLDAVCEPCFGY
jgi:hypothetical protein